MYMLVVSRGVEHRGWMHLWQAGEGPRHCTLHRGHTMHRVHGALLCVAWRCQIDKGGKPRCTVSIVDAESSNFSVGINYFQLNQYSTRTRRNRSECFTFQNVRTKKYINNEYKIIVFIRTHRIYLLRVDYFTR